MDQGSIPPTLPFRLAAAYGAPGTRPVPAQPSGRGVGGVARVISDTDTVELSSARRGTQGAAGAGRLVAARVNVPVDFDLARPPAPPVQGALPLYRHPADKNAAATAVNVGRSIDLTG